MNIVKASLAITALGMASASAQAHPGNGLQNLLAHAMQHGIESVFLIGCALCIGGYLANQARCLRQRK